MNDYTARQVTNEEVDAGFAAAWEQLEPFTEAFINMDLNNPLDSDEFGHMVAKVTHAVLEAAAAIRSAASGGESP